MEAGGEGEITGARSAAASSRLLVELRTKVAVLLGLTVGICVPYYFLQRYPVLPLRTVPQTPLDAWVPFDPGWVYAYGSIALLVPLLPLLATHRDHLLRYAKGLALLCAACFLVFLVSPVAGPRPSDLPEAGLYRQLISVDRSFNSLPSLHAGLTVYSLLFGYRVLRDALPPGERAAYLPPLAVSGNGR